MTEQAITQSFAPPPTREEEEKILQALFAHDAKAHLVDLDPHPDVAEAVVDPYDYDVYIAGPMTGYPEYNFPAFNEAETVLVGNGFDRVFNPATHGVIPGWKWADYLAYDLRHILKSKAVCLLPGWGSSKGARLEAWVAQSLGRRVFYYEDFQEAEPWDIEAEIRKWIVLPYDAVEAAPEVVPEEAIDEEAKRIVRGDRNNDYGTPFDDFTATGKIWSGLMYYKLRPGQEITAEDIALMMTALKLRRQTHMPKRDNLVDAHGYLYCLEDVIAERKSRAEA